MMTAFPDPMLPQPYTVRRRYKESGATFTLELAPDAAAPDKIGRGEIKRIQVPNSWAGDYTKYSKFISAAQEFFGQSFGEPVPKAETRRFGV